MPEEVEELLEVIHVEKDLSKVLETKIHAMLCVKC